ncbi:MAG: glycosyltransferase [Bdellovibrionales bacterium]|nr:glycosyltransferase [Bdellovibrionales bacterium]
MESPLISIVIPVYNGAQYLKETIESVLHQTYKNIELIVVDDGSTDESLTIAKSFANRLTVVSQKNGGQSSALNHGWQISGGQLIGYVSADDKLLPHCVEEVVKAFSQNPEIVLFYPDYELIDDKSVPFKVVYAPEFSRRQLIAECLCAPGPGAFFSKDIFKKTSGWNADLRFVPDWEYWLRLSKFGNFQRIPLVLAQFRVHDGSTVYTPPSRERADETLNVITKYFQDMSTENPLHPWKNQSVSYGHIYSSRHHLASGRFFLSLKHALSAIFIWPPNIANVFFWRFIMGGFRKFIQTRFLK